MHMPDSAGLAPSSTIGQHTEGRRTMAHSSALWEDLLGEKAKGKQTGNGKKPKTTKKADNRPHEQRARAALNKAPA
jgi:hypothetical protein